MNSKTIAFHTFGCKVNQYETEELRHQLSLGGFQIVPFEQGADVVLINSCSVTADADSSCRQLIRKVLREQPETRVVVTGCYAERQPDELREISSRVEVYGNHEKPLIAMALGVPTACVVEAAKAGVVALAERTRAYIKVQDGCDAKCTYCIIPSVRPNLICRDPELILKEARNLISLRGFKEIVLTGVRLGRYESPGWDLTRLVQSLIAIEGDFRIRLSSIEVTEIADSLIDLMAREPKLCAHFHIPLQSGDNEVLKRMGRWYTADEYRARVQHIKTRIPNVALSADVIVGFPGEETKNFENTIRLVEDEGYSRLHVFRFSVRPGTPAERLSNQIDPRTKSARTRALIQVDRTLRYRYASRFINQEVKVLMEAESGYTERYVRVRSSSPLSEGAFHHVRPTRVTPEAILEVS